MRHTTRIESALEVSAAHLLVEAEKNADDAPRLREAAAVLQLLAAEASEPLLHRPIDRANSGE